MPICIKSVYIGTISGGIVNFGDVCSISPIEHSKSTSGSGSENDEATGTLFEALGPLSTSGEESF
ncbi:hypothetical protein FZC66_07635 [Priestia megaterium]|nr:hypothetical protein FZC66_07635 [Priestia megaterium]